MGLSADQSEPHLPGEGCSGPQGLGFGPPLRVGVSRGGRRPLPSPGILTPGLCFHVPSWWLLSVPRPRPQQVSSPVSGQWPPSFAVPTLSVPTGHTPGVTLPQASPPALQGASACPWPWGLHRASSRTVYGTHINPVTIPLLVPPVAHPPQSCLPRPTPGVP